MASYDNPVLTAVGLVKRFPGVVALNGVDLDIYPGQVHVLLGENGAGKSTLIKIISGVYEADGGEIYLKGQRLKIRSPGQALQRGISTIYQEQLLVSELSAAENICLGRETRLRGFPLLIDGQAARLRAVEYLDLVGLKMDPAKKVQELTLVERQLVAIAKALSVEAKILIMDEPTSPLTDVDVKRLFEVLLNLKEAGVGILYVTHRLDEARIIGDWITVLRDGQVAYSSAAADTSLDTIVRFMIGREIKEFFPKELVAAGKEVLRLANFTRPGAFEEVGFSLREGETLGLFGLIGSGRTELVRAISGLERIEQGEMWFAGQPVTLDSPGQAIAKGIGFLPSDRKAEGLVQAMMVRENISLSTLSSFSTLGILNRRKESRVAKGFIDALRIKTRGDKTLVRLLSGGNQQKVVLAKALCQKSRLFIFDEPTQGVDVGTKVEIYRLMNELAKQGAGILMISSELPELMGMSDRILVMNAGKINGEFCRQEFSPEEIMLRAFGRSPHQ